MNSIEKGDKLSFLYTNWKGETSVRNAIVNTFHLGSNQWHPQNQFLLTGLDVDKNAMRCFALKDMSNIVVTKNEW